MESTDISDLTMEFKILALDFDGVILDSVDVKDKAYHEVFHDYGPALQEEALQYHKANPGIDRKTKIQLIGHYALNTRFSDEELMARSRQLSQIIMSRMADCPETEGLRDFLRHFRKPVYIVTAAPEDEVVEVVNQIGLGSLFRAIKGSPTKKADHLKAIIRKEQIEPGELLFVGDKDSDRRAASDSGATFIGMSETPEELQCQTVVADFNELGRYLAL